MLYGVADGIMIIRICFVAVWSWRNRSSNDKADQDGSKSNAHEMTGQFDLVIMMVAT